MRNSTALAFALILVGAAAAVWPRVAPSPPVPTPVPERPSAALAAAVAPVAAILRGHAEDGRRLAGFYSSLADVVARDEGRVLQTTAHLRELNRRAGLLAFQRTGVAGKHPGLAEAIDKVLIDEVGLENVALDAAKRKRAVDALKALAWACGGKDA